MRAVFILVVVAIIALLAAILFPVFGRARENARRASCQSNLKQIALGIKQYIGDYDERFPLAFVDRNGTFDFEPSAPGPNQDLGWAQLLQPYLRST